MQFVNAFVGNTQGSVVGFVTGIHFSDKIGKQNLLVSIFGEKLLKCLRILLICRIWSCQSCQQRGNRLDLQFFFFRFANFCFFFLQVISFEFSGTIPRLITMENFVGGNLLAHFHLLLQYFYFGTYWIRVANAKFPSFSMVILFFIFIYFFFFTSGVSCLTTVLPHHCFQPFFK